MTARPVCVIKKNKRLKFIRKGYDIMNIDVSKNGTSLLITVSGRIDPTTAPEFEKAVMDNIDGVRDFVLDLKDVPYTSSAGLRTLLLAQKKMMKQGSMVLKNVQSSVLEVLKVTGYIKFLNIQ